MPPATPQWADSFVRGTGLNEPSGLIGASRIFEDVQMHHHDPGVVSEFLYAVADQIADLPRVAASLTEYERRITPILEGRMSATTELPPQRRPNQPRVYSVEQTSQVTNLSARSMSSSATVDFGAPRSTEGG